METNMTSSAAEKPSFKKFIGVELTRNYVLDYDQEQFSAVRKKVYLFMWIPWEVEKFMSYGFFQCSDSFLFVFTFLPLRFLWAVYSLFSKVFFYPLCSRPKPWLKSAQICDMLKVIILTTCCIFMSYMDTSVMYHLIKSQSVIKLYIFYNMLEVADRLFSAFGQDILDALYWTATEPKNSRAGILGAIFHFVMAVIYVFLHSLLVLMQVTILNVAINSNNRSLLVIMLSNNFIEIKGSVFKKFDKNNLFQVTCSDVRERFHLVILLSIVVLLTMKEYNWSENELYVLLFDCLIVLVAEMAVDWIKHAFITKFNDLPIEVYKDYNFSLAYDIAQTHQKHAFTDHSDLVARRMGFIPLPLSVVVMHVLRLVLTVDNHPAWLLIFLGFLVLVTSRVINNIYILGEACNLIQQHHKEKQNVSTTVTTEKDHITTAARKNLNNIMMDSATTPTHPNSQISKKKASIDTTVTACVSPIKELSCPPQLRSPAIFSNSNVKINEISLNEEVLKGTDDSTTSDSHKLESIGECDIEIMTRSEPNIQCDINEKIDILQESINNLDLSSDDDLANKRAESEPVIPTSQKI